MSTARVLVVEDEMITAMDIEERLHRLGYSVPAVVSSGEEAIRRVEETQPDVVLMDIVLNGSIDGVEAALEVQSRLGIPVVYLTAYSDNATWDRAKVTEPFGYLVKPVKDRDLRTSIEIALRRREAERRPIDRERWIGQFTDCADIAMMTFDRRGTVTLMNSAARELTGWEHRDAVGKHVTEVFDLQDKETALISIARALKKGVEAGLTYDAWLVARDGTEAPVQYSVVPVTDREGNNTGAILFFQLIQKDGPAETAPGEGMLAHTDSQYLAGQGIVESERKDPLAVMEALADRSPLATVLLDAQGQVRMCNAAFEDLFLYRRDEIIGCPLGKLILVEDTETEHFEAGPAVLSGQALHITGFRRRKDGQPAVVELFSVPLLLQGKLEGIQICYQDISQRTWEEGQLRHQVACDPLTGLANCRSFIDVLESEIRGSHRTGQSFALLMLDVDDLKQINDHYGHLVGSRALCRLATILRTHCRVLDTAARYGGDEFALILLGAGETTAGHVLRRIADELAKETEKPPLTVSAGVAVYPRDGESVETLLGAADRALYESKRRHGHKLSDPV